MTTRWNRTDAHGTLDQATIADGETCIIFSDEMRVALIEWIGKTSPDDRRRLGLTPRQAALIGCLYNLLQT